ncbi:hypothetical protein AMATHDRAFT_137635 [Amanita thiersii Skay4041]|uniref:Uncharacterized protein n=1 Tax=Amanita thiersii Skay4041 TaxID=703135 RepID=A0A2A9NQN4_9AGAR|nr:hypothetical protein AMATHDRAFT_137635 [Amanita thiersii Skay4041]
MHPSLLWIAIPSVLILSGYLTRRWYLSRRLRVYGIGKGAPGFQTNVKKISVTPEIAARLRRGEDVSPEEITEASALAEKVREASKLHSGGPTHFEERVERRINLDLKRLESSVENEWLPEAITKPKKRGNPRRR